MNTLEVMRRVLTAYDTHDLLGMEAHMQDLRRAIEQAERQEPVAWGYMHNGVVYDCICPAEHERVAGEYTVPLYTAPPQQEKQEPVAWLYRDSWGTMKLSQIMPPPVGAFPVYTAPPQRQPLTEEDIDQGLLRTSYALQTAAAWRDGVRFAERKHGIGGGE